jgi:hypothetical protein
MTSDGLAKRRRRKADLLHRVNKSTDVGLNRCAVFGCTRLPEARHFGLSPTLCRYHREFKSRHGCAWRRAYSGSELRPYVRTAEAFLKIHAGDPAIRSAIERIERHMGVAGPVMPINSLHRASPKRKAEGVLARLKLANVPSTRIVAVTIGVLAAVEEDPVKPGGDYVRVNVGKSLRRRGSGHHVVYGPGSRWDQYPESRGQVLVVLGAMMLLACEHVARQHLQAILAAKLTRFGPAPRPTGQLFSPRSRFGNERVKPPPPSPPPDAPYTLPRSDEASPSELDRLAEELNADYRRRGMKAFEGKF